MSELLFVAELQADGGFVARAHGQAIFVQGDTEDELTTAIRDAVHCHFDEGKGPALIRLHIVRDILLAV